MKPTLKRVLTLTLVLTLLLTSAVFLNVFSAPVVADAATTAWNGTTPKYVFLFIGDGMSYPQFASASDYLGHLKEEGKLVRSENLDFMNFPVAGSATTFDSTSFCPDSASTATSISTGFKTHSGVINMDISKTVKYETISEKLKKQLKYKIGIVSSVSINHATPASFYAHQASRNNYYDIGLELAASNFDYFGGGGFLQLTGKDNDKESLIDVAAKAGYKVATTKADILNLNGSQKALAIAPDVDGSMALPYEIDRAEGALSLADYTRKGIDVLYNETGFFMMVEGGKIDWACHANDAMTTIQDTIAFTDAVNEAIEFQKKHPADTLILVTGDHETGGLTIGYAATGYSTCLDILSEQTMSYEVFDNKVATWREKKVPFSTAMDTVATDFGLVTAANKANAASDKLVLTENEAKRLQDAYNLSMQASKERTLDESEKVLYGSYEPFSVTLTHLLNNKAGIGWTSYSHTGVPVAVFAQGVGETVFNGYYDNTDIFLKLKALTKVK